MTQDSLNLTCGVVDESVTAESPRSIDLHVVEAFGDAVEEKRDLRRGILSLGAIARSTIFWKRSRK